ncbi:hypothetical protein [Catenulispora pinisilvae]|uniref:hypothetical protein n=1 Tax=Catenulispora pinisilvae TaxID=2705253 RepID=UPI0018926C03|nr:hypothetical protein [Catenulispora pinisilvae]
MTDDEVRVQRSIVRRVVRNPMVIIPVVTLAVILVAVGGLVGRYEGHVDAEKADAKAHAVQLANDVVRAAGRTPDKPVAEALQTGERCNDGLGTIHGYHYEVFVGFSAVNLTDVDRMKSTLKAYLRGQAFDDSGAEGMTKYYGGADKLEKVSVSYDPVGDASRVDIDIEAGCVP